MFVADRAAEREGGAEWACTAAQRKQRRKLVCFCHPASEALMWGLNALDSGVLFFGLKHKQI